MTGPSKNQSAVTKITEMLRSSARDSEHRRIGIEIERIGIWPDCSPFRYQSFTKQDGQARPGAEKLLGDLATKYGWQLTDNGKGKPLGLTLDEGFGKITLEPGSQVELGTEATVELGSLVTRTQEFEDKVNKVTDPWGIAWIGLGMNPCNTVDDMDVIPSPRYHIMTDYLGKRGNLATTMMRLTSSVQINLDYRSETEGIEMLRVALAAAPISYALFANSPIKQGKETGYLSYRKLVWDETDPDRTGLIHEAFEPEFDFEKYAQFVSSKPLMFAINDQGQFIPSQGKSLEEIEQGALAGVSAHEENCLSAIRQQFTEARIKPGYVEVRSVDGLAPKERYASAAFWMGLLYDCDARQLVLRKLGKLNSTQREKLLDDCAHYGLCGPSDVLDVRDVCEQLFQASKQGLERRGFGEEVYLKPVVEILKSGKCPAQRVLDKFRAAPQNKVQTIIQDINSTRL